MHITAQAPVSEMTYTVSSGTLHSTISYHTKAKMIISNVSAMMEIGDVVGKVKISKYVMTHRYTKETTVCGATSNPIDWL